MCTDLSKEDVSMTIKTKKAIFFGIPVPTMIVLVVFQVPLPTAAFVALCLIGLIAWVLTDGYLGKFCWFFMIAPQYIYIYFSDCSMANHTTYP